MRKSALFLLVVIVVIIASFTTSFLIGQNVQVEKYIMDVRVTDDGVMGFNVDPGGFHFGSLAKGQGARRELKIQQIEEDVLVTITKKGRMAGWVSNPTGFVVRKGEEKNISFSVSVPEDAALGDYSGEVIVVLKRV